MLVGLVAGIGIAAAGGVAAYQFLGHHADDQGSVVVARAAPAHAQTSAHPAAAAPEEECWDEQVTVQNDPKDKNAIAGTAVGAVVGGAIGKDVGDRNLTTAAGAAAGAFIGRKIQQHIQDNQAEKRTETRVERRCAPAGTPH
jgi:uncharacterized protein YcfJ